MSTRTKRKPKRKSLRSIEERNVLVLANLKLATKCASDLYKKFPEAIYNYPIEDAEHDAKIGLIRACELFDASKGYKISTYATYWIRRELMVGLREATLIRTPVKMVKKYVTSLPENYQELFGTFDDSDRKIQQDHIKEIVRNAVRYLPVSYQTVLNMRMSGMTLRQIGSILGKHQEWIRQVQERALEKLRKYLPDISDQTWI